MFRRVSLRAAPFFISAAALLLAAQPAAATLVFSSATPGVWSISDSQTQPAYRCIYFKPNPSLTALTKVKVWPPKMYGKTNATVVRWRFTVGRQPPGGGSSSVPYTSPWQTGTASTSSPANSFSPMQWNVPSGAGYWTEYNLFWVQMRLEWRNGSNALKGSVHLMPDWLRETMVGSASGFVHQLPCAGAL
ncbi:MAG: hypothetical protein QOJ81_2179 [Chloroflexota bacterium]|jgi:hypothetical protein|nr:hypothetical protein [Chloroflexota bacterium]